MTHDICAHDTCSCLIVQDTNKQVKDTPFPSITICTEGINMDAIMEAVSRDYNEWLKQTRNSSTNNDPISPEENREYVKQFLFEFFSISPSYNISLDDIALAYSSPEPDKYFTLKFIFLLTNN